MNPTATACCWHIYGRVQGVGYRFFVMRHAQLLQLDGWVKNRPDGSVEVAARGSAEALALLKERCAAGPPAARVARIDEVPAPEAWPAGFSVRY